MDILEKQRPTFITMLCSFYFVYWAISLLNVIAVLLMNIGPQFPMFSKITDQINLIFLGVQVNIGLVTWFIAAGLVAGVVGFWLYQKWAVIIYIAASLALFYISLPAYNNLASKSAYIGLIFSLVASVFAINIAMIVTGIIYWKRMK